MFNSRTVVIGDIYVELIQKIQPACRCGRLPLQNSVLDRDFDLSNTALGGNDINYHEF